MWTVYPMNRQIRNSLCLDGRSAFARRCNVSSHGAAKLGRALHWSAARSLPTHRATSATHALPGTALTQPAFSRFCLSDAGFEPVAPRPAGPCSALRYTVGPRRTSIGCFRESIIVSLPTQYVGGPSSEEEHANRR